jgi:hypothetical protein
MSIREDLRKYFADENVPNDDCWWLEDMIVFLEKREDNAKSKQISFVELLRLFVDQYTDDEIQDMNQFSLLQTFISFLDDRVNKKEDDISGVDKIDKRMWASGWAREAIPEQGITQEMADKGIIAFQTLSTGTRVFWYYNKDGKNLRICTKQTHDEIECQFGIPKGVDMERYKVKIR